jgi:hypothetical protein
MYTTKIVNVEAKLSDGSMIKGKINIRDHNRVTDCLRQIQDQFIVIVSEGAGESSQKVFCIITPAIKNMKVMQHKQPIYA